MQRTSRLLRELSHLTVVVQAPRPESDVVEHLEFVRLREGQLLAVLETASGQMQNKLVPIDAPLSPGDLDRINNYLQRAGQRPDARPARVRLTSRRSPASAPSPRRAGRARAAPRARRPCRSRRHVAADVLVDGQSNLLAGKADLERAKSLLRTLEEKDLLVRLLDRTLGAPGHLRLHRRRGEPGRPHRRLGGGRALR